MSQTIFQLKVDMEDGSAWEVQADQRDFARFEREPFGLPFHMMFDRPFTTLRYLAWTAGRRNNKHKIGTFEQFEDACALVTRLDQDEDEGAVDPGKPVASAGT
jgi:hypothetical protein